MLIVLTTAPNADEAETLARKIVAAKHAACVQILPAMKSIYFWENELQTADENLLLIKTLSENYAALEKFIIENHSYDVPEIVAVESCQISKNYLQWIENCIR